jgi:UrcA family protein
MSKIVIAAIAVLSMAASAPAFAREAQPETQVLNYHNVDLNNPAAAQAFYVKLVSAAQHVCDSNSTLPFVLEQDRACVKATLADAVSRLDKPVLTAFHNEAGNKYAQLAAR